MPWISDDATICDRGPSEKSSFCKRRAGVGIGHIIRSLYRGDGAAAIMMERLSKRV